MKNLTIILSIVLIIFIAIYFTIERNHNTQSPKVGDMSGNRLAGEEFKNYDTVNININNETLKLYIADTKQKRSNGLMYISKLFENEGMIFLFEETKVHPFWMKNTLIPLDIIWINQDNVIVDIKREVQPCLNSQVCPYQYPSEESNYVIELVANKAESLDLNIGDTIELNLSIIN